MSTQVTCLYIVLQSSRKGYLKSTIFMGLYKSGIVYQLNKVDDDVEAIPINLNGTD